MDRSEHQVARFGGMNGRHERFRVAHFAHEHHVRVFAHRVLHADAEVDHVEPDFTLVDQTLVLGEHEFDRVFERENVLAILVIDQIEHRSDRRAFAGTRNPGQQHHALIEMAKLFDLRRQEETAEVGHKTVHAASHEPDVTKLLQQIHAEPPVRAFHIERMGKVGAAVLLEDLAVPLVHEREAKPDHFFIGDRLAVHRPERTVDADHWRLVHLQVQVAGLELHACPKELVDL